MEDRKIPRLQLKELPSTLRPRPRVPVGRADDFADELRRARNGWYGLWYRCLRLSEEYQHCCKNNGKGRLKPMYDDFGDVVDMSFAQWWQQNGRYLFAERKSIPVVQSYSHHRDLETIGRLRDKIVIEVPLTLRKSTVVRQKSTKYLKRLMRVARLFHANKVRLEENSQNPSCVKKP